MKSLLVTAVITTFVLALFLHSGSALVCYNCPYVNCDKTVTCADGQDTCLKIDYSGKSMSRCWHRSQCKAKYLADFFSLSNFKSSCCNWDLCNNAPSIVASKIVLSGALLLTIVHMLKFLV